MLSTIAQRCHTVLTSGDISTLTTEINNNYVSGNINYILGDKLTSELNKRKRVLWHNYSGDLSFPPIVYLADHAANQIDSRITGSNPTTDKAIFSALNHSTPLYTRSTTCWASDIDLTPISPWNSDAAGQKAGVALSPKHVLFATHHKPAVNSTIRFVTLDNTIITRTISAIQSIPTIRSLYPDLAIGLLDSDLPTSIKFAKVLPENWIPYFPLQNAPLLMVNSSKNALVTDLYEIFIADEVGDTDTYLASARIPTDATRLSFYSALVMGDSGSPLCMIINGELVIVTVATTGGGGSGTHVPNFIDELNAIMTSLGGGYQLSQVSLAPFTQVSPPTPTPTLSLDAKGATYFTLSWDGAFNANIYVDGELNTDPDLGHVSPVNLNGLTPFVEIEVKIKPLIGHLEGSFSNAIVDYPSYGPVSCPHGSSSGLIYLPSGSWTLSTLFWGVSPDLEDMYIYNGDYSIGYYYKDGVWKDAYTLVPVGDEVINFHFELFSEKSVDFTMWNGQGPP